MKRTTARTNMLEKCVDSGFVFAKDVSIMR